MVTEVLRPRNCLVDPSVSFQYRRKANGNTKSTTLRKSRNSKSNDVKKNRKNDGPVMGQVTILKRGEPLNSKIKIRSEVTKGEVDFIASGIDKMGLDSDLFSKDVKIDDPRSVLSPLPLSSPPRLPNRVKRLDTYAGSAVMSPSPNSLPLPSFSTKKKVSKIVQDSAATDLCRILQLD